MKEARPIEVIWTRTFEVWLNELRDKSAKVKITTRVDRLAEGNPGDVKAVGEGVSELRIKHGPGYRLYVKWNGAVVVILLCGGDKSTQQTDIAKAKEMAKELEERNAD